MKEIPLTHKTETLSALVSDEDFDSINTHIWRARWNKKTQSYYAVREEGIGAARKTIYMAREIMQTPKGMICDHINHKTLDNQRDNLRNCTHQQNSLNRRLRADNRLGIKGVRERQGKYQARVMMGGKYVFDQTFLTVEEAISARNEVVREVHGVYASV